MLLSTLVIICCIYKHISFSLLGIIKWNISYYILTINFQSKIFSMVNLKCQLYWTIVVLNDQILKICNFWVQQQNKIQLDFGTHLLIPSPQ